MTEPREVIVSRWRCAFCSRGYSRRKLAVEHMEGCRENPDNIARLARANAAYEATREDKF
jgi:hypothetical protein